LEFKKVKDTYYIRLEKGEEIVSVLKSFCKSQNIKTGYFQGIGACDYAVLLTYIQEKQDFTDHKISGMLELVSLMGNITTDKNGEPFEHSHVMFSYIDKSGQPAVVAGHLKEARIGLTGEIVLNVSDDIIGRKFDSKSGIEVWNLT